MDINTTFPLNEKFCAYNRILSLVAAVDVKTGKIKHEISARIWKIWRRYGTGAGICRRDGEWSEKTEFIKVGE